MYTAIKGIYENGKLTLLEPAPDVEKAEVLVTAGGFPVGYSA